ncbi:MAG: XisI protein [Candidatus Electrothrix sp. MAN1_4]|nr:XisI protein [Candidatus Electrothrix sp. MAN1_4]
MAVKKEYRDVIKSILSEYARHRPTGGEIEMETIFDDIQGRYQLVAFGWQGKKRVHGCLIHIDLKNEKVWLQHDSTDAEIAQQLVEQGISADQIVLGFQPENYRRHSGFGVN